jgi:hypothetical protein
MQGLTENAATYVKKVESLFLCLPKKLLQKKVQAALAIRRFGIRGFDYSRT